MNIEKDHMNIALRGVFILTIAGLVTKILSAAYRVPYQNIVGDIGFYIYQQVYPFYGMSVVLATSGFPVMISKVMSDLGHGKSEQDRSKIMSIAMIYLTIFGVALFFLLYIYSQPISIIMGDAKLAPLIEISSLSFLLVPFISLLRGYFQFEQNMQPTAVSQVVEQGFRVSFILISSYFFIYFGYDLYTAGWGALVSSVMGSIGGFSILLFLWRRNKRERRLYWNLSASIQSRDIVLSLLKYSFSFGITSLLLILIQLVDALHLYALLLQNGIDEEMAKVAKGVYDRGQPLIQLGTVVATSFALSLVPAIAQAKMQKNEGFIKEKLQISLKLCLVIGAGAAGGLIALIDPINMMLFKDISGSKVLMILSGSILFTSICLTMFAVLQGLGYTFVPSIAVVIGVAFKYLGNIMLIPKYDTMGAAISSLVAYFIVALVMMVFIKVKGFSFPYLRTIGQIGMSIIIMFITLKLGLEFVGAETRANSIIISLFGVFIGGMIYIVLILKMKVFLPSEIQYIPVVKKLYK
ncbi:putative polysaccharide biosynthesis protein [Metabacillus halosaccharovorans]|uniref:putative polysaccharide biosynthesis protein n=1 Tax=Metabacillus halosaccharovorans TaxID=930124 RepID=UPI001C2001B8|nr:polysaccharide biosynthesis protein [Metabacillus halosaccharovorans]MBU7594085.1 polysaccharide biosynthesis protein [Metabacillus halosaccharovorans]